MAVHVRRLANHSYRRYTEHRIEFRHTDGGSGRYYIVEYVSAGLATFDYDRDGDIDIYFLNGAPMKGSKSEAVPTNALYRNDGNWRFTDVTAAARVGDAGHGLGVTVGDYDNDGLQDLYINNYGPNVLYRNNGDGTFSDATSNARVANGSKVGAGVCFLDIERDGDLDLYVANYIKFSFEGHVPRTRQGNPIYGSPLDYRPEPDTLYRNNGDGTFTDVTEESGIADHIGYGMEQFAVISTTMATRTSSSATIPVRTSFFETMAAASLRKSDYSAALPMIARGKIQGTMGLACADFDNDGFFDFHATSYQKRNRDALSQHRWQVPGGCIKRHGCRKRHDRAGHMGKWICGFRQ